MQPEFRQLPLAQLRVSATLSQVERRQHLDKNAIAELAESIATVGILQPLVVRPVIEGHGKLDLFEIVAGERRFQAAKLAKLEAVPVTVRQLTDEQVLEVQLVENLQRADVHPMAEAEGYEGLRKIGRTVDEIADKVGKSKAYVYARMKLLELAPAARKAYYEGKLSASTALYIARVPKGLQEKALKEITHESWNGMMSARNALDHIQRNYMLRLAEAPFDIKSEALHPVAGPCGACPKRTGNQPQLFGDVKGADVCTDPLCFQTKVGKHIQLKVDTAKTNGQRVIEGKEVQKVMPSGSHSLSGFVNLEDRNFNDDKNRQWRTILGKSYVPTLIVDKEKNRIIEAAPLQDLPKGSQRKGRDPSGDPSKAAAREAQQKNELERAYRAALFHKIRAKASVEKKLSRLDLEDIALKLFERLSHDEQRQLFKVMGWEGKKGEYGVSFELPVDISEHTDAQLAQFMRDLVLAPELMVFSYGSGKGEGLHDAAAFYKIDAKKVRAELTAAAKAKAKEKAKPAARAKAKKK